MAMNVKIILSGRGLSMLRSLLRSIYVPAAAAIALSLQGCDIVTTCPPENLPRYVATLTVVNESSHTVAISDWLCFNGACIVPDLLRLEPGETSERYVCRTSSNVIDGSLDEATVVYDDVLKIRYVYWRSKEYGHSLVNIDSFDMSEVLVESDYYGDESGSHFMKMYTFTFTDEDYETAVRLSGEQ